MRREILEMFQEPAMDCCSVDGRLCVGVKIYRHDPFCDVWAEA